MTGKLATIVIIAALLGPMTSVDAHALVLCKGKSGALALRESCKRKETPVDATAIGTVGAPGAPAPTLRVVDANGRQVGDLTDTAGQVAFLIGNRTVHVGVGTNGFVQQVTFQHASANCGGDRFIGVYDPARLVRFAGVSGTTGYYGADPTQEMSIASFEYTATPTSCASDGGTLLPNGFCCRSQAAQATLVGVAATLDLSGYTPPFRAELTP